MSPVTSAIPVICHSVSAAGISFAAVTDANLSIIDVSDIVSFIKCAQWQTTGRLVDCYRYNLSLFLDDESKESSVRDVFLLISGRRVTNNPRPLTESREIPVTFHEPRVPQPNVEGLSVAKRDIVSSVAKQLSNMNHVLIDQTCCRRPSTLHVPSSLSLFQTKVHSYITKK